MKLIAFLILVVLCRDAVPQSFDIRQVYPIDQSHSYVGFKIEYMGYASVRGRFQNFRGAVYFDENDVMGTSVSISIDVNSIDTDNEWRDKDLQSDQWFDAAVHPFITFVSSKALKTINGFDLTGDLTIRGVKKSITIPMTHTKVMSDVRDDTQIIFNGNLTINRIDFGVEGKRWAGIRNEITAVSDHVDIELTVLCKRINAPNFRNWVANLNSDEGKLYSIAINKGVKDAVAEFDRMVKTGNTPASSAMNTAGQMLLKEGKIDDALTLFKRNSEAFPEEALVYESLGEALAIQGKFREAKYYYQKAAAKDQSNAGVSEVLRHLINDQ